MIEAQARYARASSGKSFQLVHCWLKVRHCEKFASLRQNKMPSRKQDAAPEGEEQQEASQGPPFKCTVVIYRIGVICIQLEVWFVTEWFVIHYLNARGMD